jgi:two-component system cell cycle response regulator
MGKGNILVVDDSPLVLDVISKFLCDNGYKTITASNGIEAIEEAYRDRPDLIVLDVMMPKMNGYQTCRLLKSDPETNGIPIIMLTVKDHASDKYWGVQTGADAYLSKEFKQNVLLETVEDLIQKSQKIAPESSLIRENTLIDAVDIISKVNDLLDKELFEATVLNEMSSLIGKGIEDFEGTVDIVMGTLAKILDFNIAVIVIAEESGMGCFYKINYPVSDQYLKQVQEYTNNYLKANNIYLTHAPETTVFDTDKIKQADNVEKQEEIGFFGIPVMRADRLSGLVILAHNISGKIDSKEIEFFKNVVRQAYIIMENAWLYNKVKRLAITDSLTGIYNHGFMYDSVCKEYARAERNYLSLSFLMLDLDYFKKVNDTYGHQQGDSVLRKLSQILRNHIRVYDIAGRYGGEEFSIILPETNTKIGMGLAERIRGEVEQYNFGDENQAIRCTVSIGVSSYPGTDVKNAEDLIKKADKALYKAKAEGRNRVCV